MLGTGQVYLVRAGISRPFREENYDGPVMSAPQVEDAFNHRNWLYGADKRDAEDELMRGHREAGFPVTVLRLPMVNSERDHHGRIRNYLRRMRAGESILIPEGPHLALRHVYGGDVVAAICRVIDTGLGEGKAYNVAQDETAAIDDFLGTLAERAGVPLRIERRPRDWFRSEQAIEEHSPFSEPWMSEIDNSRGKREIGFAYTPLATYLGWLA